LLSERGATKTDVRYRLNVVLWCFSLSFLFSIFLAVLPNFSGANTLTKQAFIAIYTALKYKNTLAQ
jgi:hypothetical protein